jgi:large subunit ribosomal protein L3
MIFLTKKKNMTQIFDEQNNVVPVTILDYSECRVQKGQKNSGNFIGIGVKKNPSKSESGIFGSENVPQLYRNIDEAITDLDPIAIGDTVEVWSTSKGKGFAGVMRMWNFKGGKRTHGQSDRERHPGSIGSRTVPGKVFKGKRMGRRKGGETVTVKGLKIVSIDTENKLLCVRGSVPGTYDSIIFVNKQ